MGEKSWVEMDEEGEDGASSRSSVVIYDQKMTRLLIQARRLPSRSCHRCARCCDVGCPAVDAHCETVCCLYRFWRWYAANRVLCLMCGVDSPRDFNNHKANTPDFNHHHHLRFVDVVETMCGSRLFRVMFGVDNTPWVQPPTTLNIKKAQVFVVVDLLRVVYTGHHTEVLEPQIVSIPLRRRRRWWLNPRVVDTAHHTKGLEPCINLETPVP